MNPILIGSIAVSFVVGFAAGWVAKPNKEDAEAADDAEAMVDERINRIVEAAKKEAED